MRHFPADKAEEVVLRLGVRLPDWRAAASRWSSDMETSASSGRADLVQRYSTTFARTKRRLASLRPTVESLGPLPEPDPAAAGAEPLPAPALDHLPAPGEPQVAVPSYMSGPSPGGPVVPAYMQASPPPAPDSTASPPPPDVATEAVPMPIAPRSAPRVRTLALPVAAPPQEQLPFKPLEGTAEEAVERALAQAVSLRAPTADRPAPLGATLEPGATVGGPLPFGRSALPIPEYTLERYASLKVELREYADRVADVLARYKLDSETAAALDDDWKRRMNADSTLRSRFLDACEKYRGWLRSRDASRR